MTLATALAFTIAVLVAAAAGYIAASLSVGRILGSIAWLAFCDRCGKPGMVTRELALYIPELSRWTCRECSDTSGRVALSADARAQALGRVLCHECRHPCSCHNAGRDGDACAVCPCREFQTAPAVDPTEPT